MQFGTVTGRILATIADTIGDADVTPDVVPVSGKVRFTPSISSAVSTSAGAIILPTPIEADIDTQGYLSLNGQRGVSLVATDSPDLNPTDFTYTVSFTDLRFDKFTLAYPSFSMALPAGSTVDLATVTPVGSSNGAIVIRGEKGDTGDSAYDEWLTQGNVGTPAQFLAALKGPQGDRGPTGDDTATAAYFAAPSATRTAADARYAQVRTDVVDTATRGATVGAGSPGLPIDAIMAGALAEAKAATRQTTSSLDRSGSRVIDLPAGDYSISTINGLLGSEGMTAKANGLRFRGAGKGLTRIIFSPETAGPLLTNDFWANISFSGITFLTTVSGADFMHSYTTHNAQNYTFVDCSWSGPWNHVFDLQGNDNNSEFSFIACATSGMLSTGAFLYVGADNTSDQFLNYWFFGFKHWSTTAALVDMAKGGSVHMFGVDVSDWGSNSTVSGHALINLRGSSHAQGVCELQVSGLRVEAKSNNAKLLYSEWPQGTVSIQCDWSSQAGGYTYGDIIKIAYANYGGAIYNFHDSVLAGGINVAYASSDFNFRHAIRVRDTTWLQRNSPSDVVAYTKPASNFTDPQVEFINCRGGRSSVSNTNGVDVWDATIGWQYGDLVKPVQLRSIQVRNASGNPNTGNNYYINLPVGAMVTGMRAFAPSGDTTQSDTGTWTLSNRDTSPAIIGSVTSSGARSVGYNVTSTLSVPYLADTRARANLVLTPSNVTQIGRNSIVTIDGYW